MVARRDMLVDHTSAVCQVETPAYRDMWAERVDTLLTRRDIYSEHLSALFLERTVFQEQTVQLIREVSLVPTTVRIQL